MATARFFIKRRKIATTCEVNIFLKIIVSILPVIGSETVLIPVGSILIIFILARLF